MRKQVLRIFEVFFKIFFLDLSVHVYLSRIHMLSKYLLIFEFFFKIFFLDLSVHVCISKIHMLLFVCLHIEKRYQCWVDVLSNLVNH